MTKRSLLHLKNPQCLSLLLKLKLVKRRQAQHPYQCRDDDHRAGTVVFKIQSGRIIRCVICGDSNRKNKVSGEIILAFYFYRNVIVYIKCLQLKIKVLTFNWSQVNVYING